MPAAKLKDYLDSNSVKYVSIIHSTAFTAQENAASAHIPGRNFVKAVMIKIKGKMAMAVLPASFNVVFDQLDEVLGTEDVQLATEVEFKDLFPDCEIGAMPPFGNLYGMEVFADESISEDKEIAFNAGSHREIIKLAYEDFERLVQPTWKIFTVNLVC